MGSVLVNIVTLTLWGVSSENEWNFLNGDTSHVTPNPIASMNKVIKVVPSYFWWGVYFIWIHKHELHRNSGDIASETVIHMASAIFRYFNPALKQHSSWSWWIEYEQSLQGPLTRLVWRTCLSKKLFVR